MTEVKICGITRLEDALCAAACGADAVGFIFHPTSPRYITPERARAIIARLPEGIATVGVFVNRKREVVEQTAETCGLDLIQLHGDESPAYCRQFPPGRVIKAVSPGTSEAVGALDLYDIRAFLVDARDTGRYGGTGRRSDWGLSIKIREAHPLILAGGLDPGNIEEALAAVAPHAVDINSGCELAPGIKDHDQMRKIVALIRKDNPPGPKVIFDGFVKSPLAAYGKVRRIRGRISNPSPRAFLRSRPIFKTFSTFYEVIILGKEK